MKLACRPLRFEMFRLVALFKITLTLLSIQQETIFTSKKAIIFFGEQLR